MPKSETRFKPRALLYVIVPLIICAGCYWWLNQPYFKLGCDRGGDFALTELEIEKIKRGEVILNGPYSRYRVNHPGPALFYLHAYAEPLMPLLPTAPGRHAFIQSALNLLIIALTAFILLRYSPWPALSLILWPICLWAIKSSGTDILESIWGPAVIVLPMLLYIVTVSLIALGQLQWLIPATFVAALMTQTHLATLPIVSVLGLISVIAGLYKTRGTERSSWQRLSVIGAPWLLLLLFSPPLYDLMLHGSQSNLANLIRFISTTSERPAVPDAVSYLLSFYYRPFKRFIPLPGPLLAVIIIALPLALRRDSSPFLRSLRIFSYLGLGISFLSVLGMSGKLHRYLIWWHYALVILFIILCFATIIDRLSPYIRPAVRTFLNFASSAAVLLVLIAGILPNYEHPARPCRQSYNRLLDVLPKQELPYELHIHHAEQWPTVALIALNLYRASIPFCLSPGWSFMFGSSLTCPPDIKPAPLIIRRRSPDEPVQDLLLDFGQTRVIVPGSGRDGAN